MPSYEGSLREGSGCLPCFCAVLLPLSSFAVKNADNKFPGIMCYLPPVLVELLLICPGCLYNRNQFKENKRVLEDSDLS